LFLRGFTQLIDRIRAIAERVAGSCGLEIFDLQFRRESNGWVLRIFVDVPDTDEAPAAADASVTIQDCERVSRDVSAILDVEETIDHRFTLEVSSPGLDRPLRSARDYRRFAGCLAKIVVTEPVDNQKYFEGRLRGLEEDAVIIETAPGKRHVIPVALIARGRLDVEF
jgi:ribosome maturation factor RimP